MLFMKTRLASKPSEEIAGGKWIEYHIGNGTFAITNINPKWTPGDQGTAVGFEVDDFEKRMLS
jgi:hypothetical protein